MRPIIEIRDLTAGYDGVAQIHNISMTVCQGDFLAITGPNGGGKTTLVRVMLGLLHPMSGSIGYFHDGNPVSQIRMGYLPQQNNLDRNFPISVKEVIEMGCPDAKVDLTTDPVISRLVTSELLERPIKALSGGEFQRVLLARAVATRPEVLVLDEPDTYIDHRFEKNLYEQLRELNQRHTIVMVSHNAEAVRQYASRIVAVDETMRILR